MITVEVIYNWSIWGHKKGDPFWAVSRCKIKHGKVKRN